MTLNYIINQVYHLSVNGYFNHQKFTFADFKDAITRWMRGTNRYILEISLPDGWWYMSINKYNNNIDGYDYFIPDNREQEKHLLNYLVRNKSGGDATP